MLTNSMLACVLHQTQRRCTEQYFVYFILFRISYYGNESVWFILIWDYDSELCAFGYHVKMRFDVTNRFISLPVCIIPTMENVYELK